MLAKANLPWIAVSGHRTLGQRFALVRRNDGARRGRDGECDCNNESRVHEERTITPDDLLRAVPVYTSAMRQIAAAVALGVLSCGGGVVERPAPASATVAGVPAASVVDVSFDIPVAEIKGVAFEPAVLDLPPLPAVPQKALGRIPTKAELDKQRSAHASAKQPSQKQAHAAILAAMLYAKASETTGDDSAALFKEGRDLLRDAVVATRDKADEATLRLLGSYELANHDYSAAAKVWHALATKRPRDPDAPVRRAWWTLSLIRGHKNAEAVAVAADSTPTAKQPELAYATAWARWFAGDHPGAWSAIVEAAKGWGRQLNRDALDRELVWFAARVGGPFRDAAAQLSSVDTSDPTRYRGLLAQLGLSEYPSAGRWADAVAAVEALVVADASAPTGQLAKLRYRQAEYSVLLGDPAAAATRGKQAIDALQACASNCVAADATLVVDGLYRMGRLFHVLFATANDTRYYQPAHDLYTGAQLFLLDSDPRRQQAASDAKDLEGSHKAMQAEAGTHDKAAITALLGRRASEVQACYEQGLAANLKLGGTLIVTLESDHGGSVRGVTTEPPAGATDLAMVAGCVEQRIRTWSLPKRANGAGPKGVTRVKLSYSMSATPQKR